MPARFDSRAITVMVAQGTSPERRSAALATAARTGVAELIRTGHASPKYRRFVDGTEGRDESSVRPDGTIAYRFGYMGEVVAFALAYVRDRGPIRDGKWRRSLTVAVNGRPIPAAQFNPDSVPEDATILCYSPLDYSRKVDVQLVGGKRLRFKVPPGIFDDAARAVRGRFGNLVNAQRLYTVRFAGEGTRKGGRRRKDGAGRRLEYPALEISPR